MDEDEKPETEANDLTPKEQEIEDETEANDLTPEEREIEDEEARSIGEFDDLRDRLERIEIALGNITLTLEAMRTTAAAIDIDNGADVADVDGDGDVDVVNDDEVDIIPDYDDMDLDL